jgi:large subunit ribosomal protein L7/L12
MAMRRTVARRSGGGAGQAVTVLVVLALLAGLAWFGWDRMQKFKAKSAEVPTGPRVTLLNWTGSYRLQGNIPDPLPDPWKFCLESADKQRPLGQEGVVPQFWVEIQFEGGRFTGMQIAQYREADVRGKDSLIAEAEFSGAEGAALLKFVSQLGEKPARASIEGQTAGFELFAWKDMEGKGLRKTLTCAVRRGSPEAAKMIARARAEWAAGTAGGTIVEAPRTKFDVVLAEVGKNREAVLAVVCEIANLSPEAGATLVDSAPKPIKLSASKDEAEAIRKKLEAAGAKVEVK